ncbi:DUF2933 domain-containing protein [uncultured Serinicoccus sp.]|uniref:DUF2933 domain-containing protein n=1 Tax=uncultured Serinicoccus sp. TaxID=735514 RepID=UPI00263664EB|nr:DUF2933 domain-containing protein [uncultured Serinicoccus sp.]
MMNHSGAGHLKGMALLVAGVFVVLLLLGRAPGEALLLAAVLSCPLMMVLMMVGGHGSHGGHAEHGPQDHADDPYPLDQTTPAGTRPGTETGRRTH